MTFDPKEHLTNLRGKDYLETKWRILWFRAENPKGQIITDLVSPSPLIYKATIIDNDGQLLGTGHGSAEPKQGAVWAGREVEKAETAAIGRALAHAGYGTQFVDEDEGDHLADSPVEQSKKSNGKPSPVPPPPSSNPPPDSKPSTNGHHDTTPAIIWPSKEALELVLSQLQRRTGVINMAMNEFARLAGIENLDDLTAWESAYSTGNAAYLKALQKYEDEQKKAEPASETHTTVTKVRYHKPEAGEPYLEFQAPGMPRMYGRTTKFREMVGQMYYNANHFDSFDSAEKINKVQDIAALEIWWKHSQSKNPDGSVKADYMLVTNAQPVTNEAKQKRRIS